MECTISAPVRHGTKRDGVQRELGEIRRRIYDITRTKAADTKYEGVEAAKNVKATHRSHFMMSWDVMSIMPSKDQGIRG